MFNFYYIYNILYLLFCLSIVNGNKPIYEFYNKLHNHLVTHQRLWWIINWNYYQLFNNLLHIIESYQIFLHNLTITICYNRIQSIIHLFVLFISFFLLNEYNYDLKMEENIGIFNINQKYFSDSTLLRIYKNILVWFNKNINVK